MAQYDFIEAIQADPKVTGDTTSWWAAVEGKPGEPDDIIDDAYDTKAEAEKAGRAHKALMARHDREWQNEIAMEAGMLHGCDAHNEVMGY